jgi:ABC-2 type transport system ATP-binding protein
MQSTVLGASADLKSQRMGAELPRTIDAERFAISATALTKRFGDRCAVDAIDLGVPEGGCYLLCGPNGSGKTTTFNMVLGLLRPDSGTVFVAGAQAGPDGTARARLGHVPEAHLPGYPELRVRDLIEIHSRYRATWDAQYAASLAKTLEVRLEAKAGKLSKGECRRVQLLLALAHRPEVLLLDEPTDGLDRIGRDVFQHLLITHLASTPTTVLVASHVAYELEGLATEVGALRDGRLIAQVTRADLQAKLRAYEFTAPPDWTSPRDLLAGRRESSGMGRRWTIWGAQDTVVSALTASGAVVRDIASLNLDDATLALLTWEAQ